MATEFPYEYKLEIYMDCIASVGDTLDVPARAAKVVDDVNKMLREKYPYMGITGFAVKL